MRIKTVLLLALALWACKENPASIPPPEQQEQSQEQESTQDKEGPDQDYTPVSLKSTVTNVQPMTGVILWTDSRSQKSWLTMEYSYMRYDHVCKGKDQYDWSAMDDLLKEVAGRGHQAVVRFCYTYPGEWCSVPAYIKEEPGYEGIKYKTSGDGRAEYPDWRCEELQRFHMEFHRLFAERYDKDPRLAFVETGFGHWGEYHVYGGKFIAGQTFPSKAFQAEFLQAMDGWFQHTPWLISIDAADDHYAPFHEQPELLNLNFGNFDDSFMCSDHDGYNRECWEFFGEDRYKRAPLGGEFSYYTREDQQHCLDKEGMHGRVFEDEVAAFHMTFIIGADQPRYQSDERIKEAAMSMGYRFRVTRYAVKPGAGVLLRIANMGVAPFYKDAYVAVDGVRASYNLRELMPGEEVEITLPLESATLESKLTLESDFLLPGQTLPFEADLD